MTVCQSFGTTPDVASALLSPGMRDLTRACLDFHRAQRVVEEARLLAEGNPKVQAEIARRWRAAGDGAFYRELCAAAGREQPAMDEV
jgi:hypothetical protein